MDSEMLSFGVDTEVLSFLWNFFGRSDLVNVEIVQADGIISIIRSPTSPIIQFFIHPDKINGNPGFIKISAITGCLLAIVGLSSYFTYKGLMNTRKRILEIGLSNTGFNSRNEIPKSIELKPQRFSVLSKLRKLNPFSFRKKPKIQQRHVIGGTHQSEDDETSAGEELESEYFGPEESEDVEYDDPEIPPREILLELDRSISPTDSAYTSEHESILRPLARVQ